MNPINQNGRIVEWRKDRGYGFVESAGQRVFLHRRDFAEFLKAPAVGDEISFIVGADVGEFLGSLAVTVRQYLSHKSDYFVQLMDVRRIIEVEAVGSLAVGEGNAAVNGEVEDAIAGMRKAVDANDFSLFTACDAAFHLGLVHSVGNEILNVFYNNLFALITETINVSSRVPKKSLDAAFAEHDEIYRLIKQGDADGARNSIRRHIEGSAHYVRVALDNKWQTA